MLPPFGCAVIAAVAVILLPLLFAGARPEVRAYSSRKLDCRYYVYVMMLFNVHGGRL